MKSSTPLVSGSFPIYFQTGNLKLVIGLDGSGRACLLHLGVDDPDPLPLPHIERMLAQVQGDQLEKQWVFNGAAGDRHGPALPGIDMRYSSHELVATPTGRELRITSDGDGLRDVAVFASYGEIPCLRCWHEVTNKSARRRRLTRVDSLHVGCLCQEHPESQMIHRCANAWGRELQWRQISVLDANIGPGSAGLQCGNIGSWSCKRWLPMGALENREKRHCLLWQIESGGSWQWQILSTADALTLCAGGPDDDYGSWWRDLEPGESYRTVPVAISGAWGGFAEALRPLNDYRRALRRPSWDNERLPVIFNDYMNCLFADPTSEKERPLIRAAATAGCEIYCIDAGWYAKPGTGWFSTVGQWQQNHERFPEGLPALLGEIREAGMIPGLWLELEVMGYECELVRQWPPECFFRRHGMPWIQSGRYQLDFRHPKVRAHADEVVDRLVGWGVGYIKMDYNSDAGAGTEVDSVSLGAGLEDHIAAYHGWLDAVFARYPALVIENCSSGGLRMDWAKLSRHSIQSTSDQEDYRLYAHIAPALATGAPPEMQAVWSYPLRDGNLEETRFNMVNAMLGRIHQSGHLAELSKERFDAVREGIAVYKTLRDDLRAAHASWPLGLPGHGSRVCAVLLSHETRHYLAVWNLSQERGELAIILDGVTALAARTLYPADAAAPCWERAARRLTVPLDPAPSARIYRLE